MRILILGGTGLTGPFAVRRLADLGHEVTVVHRGRHTAELPAGVREIVAENLDGVDPSTDLVVHMWAMTEGGAQAFVDKFSGHAGRAVVISSGDAYRAYGRLVGKEPGPPDPVPLSEDAPLRETRYPYRGMQNAPMECVDEYDKVLVEQVCRSQSQMPVTVVRYPAVYGRNDYHRFRPWLAPMLEDAVELKVQDTFARWRWTHGYVEDVAEAVVLAASNPGAAGRTYNVGEAETPTWAERLAELAAAAGWSGRILPVPAAELPEDQRVGLNTEQDLVVDTRRIRQELGYREVVPRAEGYRRTVAWERAGGR